MSSGVSIHKQSQFTNTNATTIIALTGLLTSTYNVCTIYYKRCTLKIVTQVFGTSLLIMLLINDSFLYYPFQACISYVVGLQMYIIVLVCGPSVLSRTTRTEIQWQSQIFQFMSLDAFEPRISHFNSLHVLSTIVFIDSWNSIYRSFEQATYRMML